MNKMFDNFVNEINSMFDKVLTANIKENYVSGLGLPILKNPYIDYKTFKIVKSRRFQTEYSYTMNPEDAASELKEDIRAYIKDNRQDEDSIFWRCLPYVKELTYFDTGQTAYIGYARLAML